MKASTFAISIFVFGLLATCVMAAEERTWTDSSGKTLTGSLEEVTEDGKVKIKSNGQTFTIPIERFSDEDQKYIDSQKEEMEKATTPTRRPRKSDLFDFRQWKDNQDNEIKAKYVRMFEGQVVLLQGRTAHKVSFYDLSDEDQVYLRGELEARNEADQIPAPPANASSGGNSSGEIAGGGNQPYDPRMANQISAPPAYAPPAMDDFAKRQQEQHEKARREIEKQQEEARRAAEEARRRREEDEQRRQREYEENIQRQNQQREQRQQEQLARMNAPIGGPSMQQEWVEYKVCSSCNKEIPNNIGAGDRCPHCNVFFASETDRFGRTTKKVPVPWYYGAPIPIGLIVWVVVAVIRKMGSS